MRSGKFAMTCIRLKLTVYDIIDYGPDPPLNFNELEDSKAEKILLAVAKKKEKEQQHA